MSAYILIVYEFVFYILPINSGPSLILWLFVGEINVYMCSANKFLAYVYLLTHFMKRWLVIVHYVPSTCKVLCNNTKNVAPVLIKITVVEGRQIHKQSLEQIWKYSDGGTTGKLLYESTVEV